MDDSRCGHKSQKSLNVGLSELSRCLAAAAANPLDKGAQLNAQLALLDALLAKAGVAS